MRKVFCSGPNCTRYRDRWLKQSPAHCRALPNTEETSAKSESSLAPVAKDFRADAEIRIGANDTPFRRHDIGWPRQQLLVGILRVRLQRVVCDRRPVSGRRGER